MSTVPNAADMVEDPDAPAASMVGGSLGMARPSETDYEMLHSGHMFGDASNLVPIPQSMKGARFFLGGKYVTQALPMAQRETPYVQAWDSESGMSHGTRLGRQLGLRLSPAAGKVRSIRANKVIIDGDDGEKHEVELHQYFPHSRKTHTTDRALVKAGDRVELDQPVGASNFVDDSGHLALGRNLRVGFMAAPRGGSFEDAITVSQSAAEKMKSQHMYGFDVEKRHGTETSKSKFISLFPNAFTNEQLDKIGDDGMAKPGANLKPGDPVMLAMSPRSISAKDSALGNLGRAMRGSFENKAVLWDKNTDGVVADAQGGSKAHKVNVVTEMPMRQGDKLSALQGAKGVVGRVLPDGQMPHDAEGRPLEIFINPAALIGRVNPNMVFEALLGKIAERTGKNYSMAAFTEGSMQEFVRDELARHGMTDTDLLSDPGTGREIGDVLTGNQYFLKLEHTSDSKMSARDEGGVDINDQPSKGGKEGAKRLGGLINTALLSHGGTEVLRDAKLYRGTKNAEMWRRVRLGQPLPAPEVPFIYGKFLNTLRAAGVRVDEKPDRVSISAMTDRDVDELGGKEINSAETMDWKSNQPIPGGLFDYAKFGGPEGKGWGFIKLDHPVPNPQMEDSVRAILGVTGNQLRDVISGKEMIGAHRGPDALAKALNEVDVDYEIERAKETVRNGRKTHRNAAIKKLHALVGLQRADMSPAEMLVTKIPVLPPVFRPAIRMGDVDIVSDANYLYKDLISSRDTLRSNTEELPDELLEDDRLGIYDAVKAVTGMGEPVHPKHREKGVKGFMKTLTGTGGPKSGIFQSKVLGHPVNTVGRGVIIPDSRLDMDSVGVPEKMAWEMFGPFTMGRMVRDGMSAVEAARQVEAHTDHAKRYLLQEMEHRPVMYSRDPALHKFSIMGAKGKIVPGDSIRISPLVVGPFNADFDGDQMNIHVPVNEDAVREVKRDLMPSKNLFAIKSPKAHYTPSQEFVLGVYNATRPRQGAQPVTFPSREAAQKAYSKGEIGLDTPVIIEGE